MLLLTVSPLSAVMNLLSDIYSPKLTAVMLGKTNTVYKTGKNTNKINYMFMLS